MKLYNILWSLFILFVSVLTLLAMQEYTGKIFVYFLFSIVSNYYLYYSFRDKAIFFDTFLAVFLWLGIWLKITIHVAFYHSEFWEGLHNTALNGSDFDEALYVAISAFVSLMIASKIREKFFSYSRKEKTLYDGMYFFYKNHKVKIVIVYISLFIFIGVSNFYLGIYQRGEITQTFLPFGLNGIYKWLLLFGLSSFAALLLTYEFMLKKQTSYFIPILVLIESTVTNISLLSRGMLLNSSALGYGMIKEVYYKYIASNMKFWVTVVISFIFLFLVSVVVVNNLRKHTATKTISIEKNVKGVIGLVVNRWVGAEGLLAVSHSDKKSWELFKTAIHEKYNEHSTSFYDLNLINSPYRNIDTTKHHYMSLPGFIAFFYYAGSIVFVVFMMIIISFFASIIEILAYKLNGGSFIIASLFGEVMAYRFTHFGYVPAQSYLLFGTIIANIIIIYLMQKFFNRIYKEEIISAKKQ
ncbi:hypothetical protein [Sulfurimonas indica]|uniref:hypothetical protein n=1 Tax=Sulfurimonas indica TaxID=2508707 RepID=UPI001264C515|nr:hypothetical protein [Sulfurimonas indica]